MNKQDLLNEKINDEQHDFPVYCSVCKEKIWTGQQCSCGTVDRESAR